MEKVTVVMPGRNEADDVDATIETLFAQTRLPDEIILADGCSEDGTAERFLRHADRGVPLRVVRNEAIFVGGGRNRGAREAAHEVIVHMDFGNRADPGWLEAMLRPFEADPEVDYVGGTYVPRIDGEFERVCAAVVYFDDALALTQSREELEEAVGDAVHTALPGGMCMAYRRSIWERAGGFAEWAARGQDRLFGLRVRELGGRIAITLDAVIHFNMPATLRELFLHRFRYGLWEGRLGLPRGRFARLARWYATGAAGVLVAALVAGWWALAAAVGLAAAYSALVAGRNLRRIADASGVPFAVGSYLVAVPVLFARDAAILLGTLVGTLDRQLRPRWKLRSRTYVEDGRDALPS